MLPLLSGATRAPATPHGAWRLTPAAAAVAVLLATGLAAPVQSAPPNWFAESGSAKQARPGQRLQAQPVQMRQRVQQQAQQRRQMENLSRTAQVIAARQAAQEQARQAALAGSSAIPDGLAEGGLKVDTANATAGWTGALAPRQHASGGRTEVVVAQTEEKAILNWETFNVGRNTTVHFDQSEGTGEDGSNTWIALNRVNDPNGRPSQIAGRIKADGSVYVINRNGIVFTGSSQVNVRNLVASSLKLSDEQFRLGINAAQRIPDGGNDTAIPQFGEFSPHRPYPYGDSGFKPGQDGAPDQMGGVDRFDPGLPPGPVTVQAGASIEAAGGGKVMLFAPKVRNEGRIAAPAGQIILAAGENVYLKAAEAVDGKQAVRGLDVAVSAVSGWSFKGGQVASALGLEPAYGDVNYVNGLRDVVLPEMAQRAKDVGYEVVNTGVVRADRGNITLQAQDVHQGGVLSTSTAMNNRDGSIELRAWGLGNRWYADGVDRFINWSAGTLTVAPDSVAQVLPDFTDVSEIEASALATRYQPGWIRLRGELINVQPRASLLAPSGEILMEAAANPAQAQHWGGNRGLGDASRLYLDQEAYVSVAGLRDMVVPMSRNFIEAELRINELRDSPLQDAGSWLYGRKVIVDRRASGVFEDGPMGGVQWVQRENAAGVIEYIPGAWIGTPLADVTGWVGVGRTDLAELSADGGSITMRAGGSVITRAGSIIDISGGSVRYTDGMNTATRLRGADGRVYSMSKAMPDVVYVGIAGQYVAESQRWGVTRTYIDPLMGGARREPGYTEGRSAGSVQIYAGDAMVLEGDFMGGAVAGERQQQSPTTARGGRLELGENTPTERPWSPGTIIISGNPLRLAPHFDAHSELPENFYLSASPEAGKSRKLTYLSDRMLSESGLGDIVLNFIRGDFEIARGARLELLPGAMLDAVAAEGATDDVRIHGQVHAPGGRIRVQTPFGRLTLGEEARLDAAGQWINAWREGRHDGDWAIDGGSIALGAGSMEWQGSAVIDVSGGGRADRSGTGAPRLRAGDAGSVSLSGVDAGMDLDALALRGYAAGTAGSLSILTQAQVRFGGAAAEASNVLALPPALFGEKGFGKVAIEVRGSGRGILVAENIAIARQALRLDLASSDWRSLPSDAGLADAIAPTRPLLQAQRTRAPGSLTLSTEDGPIEVARGASIVLEPGDSLTLNAGGTDADAPGLRIAGRLEVPGGRIALQGPAVRLEPDAQLVASGVPMIHRAALGRRVGTVLAGGSIDITAGTVDLHANALIDVSGARGELDYPGAALLYADSRERAPYQALTVGSDAGSLSIEAGSGLIASRLLAAGGTESARDGTLTVRMLSPSGSGGNGPDLKEFLGSYLGDPRWSGYTPACGDACDGLQPWELAVDFDWNQVFAGWGMDVGEPVIISRAAVEALYNAGGRHALVLSDTAAGGVVQPGAIDSGLSPRALDALSSNYGSDTVRQAFLAPAPNVSLSLRPSVAAGAGTLDLSMGDGVSVALDDVRVATSQSIRITGPLIQAGTGASVLQAPHILLRPPAASPAASVAAADRRGSLHLQASETLDVLSGGTVAIRGFAGTLLEGGDLRFAEMSRTDPEYSYESGLRAALEVDGPLDVLARQVYPGTAVRAEIRSDAAITVRGQGAGPAPLSAGGRLTLTAPVIIQQGVVRAPHGQIVLDAAERLVLGAGSETSVSGAGVVVPYGMLSNNEHWRDPASAFNPSDITSSALAAPPEKRITLQAPDVALQAGAVVDISGGGDLYAWEFVPGPGGSHDLLTRPGMYAILPNRRAMAMPGDGPVGERVWLAGGPDLDAGWHDLLPARYALLPGAWAVQMSGDAAQQAGRPAAVLRDGSIAVQGRRGNAQGGEDALMSTWRVMPGSVLRRYSEYNEAMANDFFASEAFALSQYRLTGRNIVTPRLPRDGGAVVFKAGKQLLLDGGLRSQPAAGGLGGMVDITGDRIAIVGAGRDAGALRADGYLVIDAASLSGFGAGSLLVGGTRQGDPLGTRVDVTASSIVVRNGEDSALTGPEIILAAGDKIALGDGSRIAVDGANGASVGDLVITPRAAAVYTDPDGNLDDNWDGVIDEQDAADDVLTTPARDWGALLRLSNGPAARPIRENVDTTVGGRVSLGVGASLDGGAALLIDATRTTDLAASARLSAADLSVSSGRIGFGGGSVGMALDEAALAQLSRSQQLTLRSYSSFDFHRSVDLGAAGLESVVFDGGTFSGVTGADVTIRGQRIAMVNRGGAGGAVGAGGGSLTVDAQTLVLDAGDKTFGGFDVVTLAARSSIVGEGSGRLDVGSAALELNTPLLTGRQGAAQTLATSGALRASGMARDSRPAQESADSLGARISLRAGSIQFGGHAVALGGSIDMTATSGELVIAEGALLDVGGFAKHFFDVAEYADAGRISLSAVGGDLRLAAGSALNLAAHAGGGNAGTLSLSTAEGGTVVLGGAITAHAGAEGRAGAFSLDIDALPDFAGFSRQLNDAGFNRSRQFRIRQGDVTVDGATLVEDFGLTADQGRVTIAGLVDARSEFGGAIRVAAGQGLNMADGARLLAGATGELGSGRVTLEAAGGQLDLAGGLIDVAGADGGKVRLRANRTGSHGEIDVAALRTDIVGARSAVLEGMARYDVADYDGRTVDSVRAQAVADARHFGHAAPAIAARLGSGIAIMPGIEIRSDGDLALEGDWNLYADFNASREGTLTLRAAGNLFIGGHLSDGFDLAGRDGVLQDSASWNLRLVAGGDLRSSDALALRPVAALAAGQGTLTVGVANTAQPTDADPAPDNGAGKLVRTGTGDLDVRAGRDLVLAHKESVIYTAGRRDTTAWSDFTTARADAAYGIQGGNLDIQVQGGVTAQPSGQRFVEWLNRQGNLNEQRYFGEYSTGEWGWLPDGSYGRVILPAEQSSWWVNHGAFQQGVGALGGGNIRLTAGGDLTDLLVALPTTMRMRGGRTPTEAMVMETRNGGLMRVEAGGAIRGGQYYIARGTADIRAGETTTGHTVTVAWLGAAVPERYRFPLAPVLALGDASLNLRTSGDMQVQTILDPLLVRYGDGYRADGQLLDRGAYMSGYTDRTALKLVSTGGDITLVNQADFLFRDLELRSNTTDQDGLAGHGGNRYPARVAAIAFNGGLEIQGPLLMMPGTQNDLQLIAQEDVRFAERNAEALARLANRRDSNFARIAMPYGLPAMMPSPVLPGGTGSYPQPELDPLLANEIRPNVAETANPDVLPMARDYAPSRIYAAGGSVQGLDVVANEQLWVRAGTDIRGIRLDARNLHATDTTWLDAGNDILAMQAVRPRSYSAEAGVISVQGPGLMLLSAGRDVYASSLSVQTVGNQRYDGNNRPQVGTQIKGLPEQGAAVTVMAGLNGDVDYNGFAWAYLDPANLVGMPGYLKAPAGDGTMLPVYLTDGMESRHDGSLKVVRRGLVSYIEQTTGETLSPLQAWERFQQLPALSQQQFLRQIYLLELREAGRDQNVVDARDIPRNGGYNRGYAAIEKLFPGDAWKGDVAATTLMLRTMAGGDINVLVPGGKLQVAALGATVPDGHGLVTLASGHVNVFAKDDVVVNRSRILSFVPEATRQGSDQIIWSTQGDIDAGRGAKTVRVPSAPEVITDDDAETIIREKSDMSGSGIGTVGDGDVDLVAPRGTVNAGDAGIRVAGNLNIAALQVLNAANIQVDGESTGLPVVATINVGALTAASTASSAAANAAQDTVQRQRGEGRRNLPSVISVRILGFGEESLPAAESEVQRGASLPVPPYDPGSAVRLLGMGEMSPAARAQLTPQERDRLGM